MVPGKDEETERIETVPAESAEAGAHPEMTALVEAPAAHAPLEARARLRLLVDLTAPLYEQIGILEAICGTDSEEPHVEDQNPVACTRCGVTSTRGQWRSSEDRSCPFCHRSRLP